MTTAIAVPQTENFSTAQNTHHFFQVNVIARKGIITFIREATAGDPLSLNDEIVAAAFRLQVGEEGSNISDIPKATSFGRDKTVWMIPLTDRRRPVLTSTAFLRLYLMKY